MRLAIPAALTATALACTASPALATVDTSAADKAAITKVIKTAEGPAGSAACAEFTAAYLKRVFGSEKQCAALQGSGSKVTVSSISVSGNKAKAKVTEHGGDAASGTWQLTKSGGSWRVSAVRVDYWRSGYSNSWGPKYKSAGSGDPFANTAYRTCGLKRLLNLSDKAFLAFTYEMTSGHNTAIGKAFNACTSKAPGGKSPFRVLYEKALKKGFAKAGAPAGFGDCVIGKLRQTVSEPTLINTVLDGTESAAWAKLTQKVQVAANACAKGGGAQFRAPQGIRAPHPVH